MKNYADIPNTSGAFPAVVSLNATGPGETDGTPITKTVVDDLWGARQAIMAAAGLTPDDVQETVSASQFLEALRIIIASDPLWCSNWKVRTPVGSSAFREICYGNDLFVAVGDAGTIETSPDGVTWTAQTPVPPGTATFYSVCYSPTLDLFCAVGPNGRIETSPDAITWSLQTAATGTDDFESICWSETVGLYVAVGNNTAGFAAIETSPDGINWSDQTPANTIPIMYHVTYSETVGRFVIVASGGKNEYSANGTAWTAGSDAGTDGLRAVVYSDFLGLFVAVGINGSIHTSPTGSTWTDRTPAPALPSLSAVVFGNKSLIAVGAGGGETVVATSFDSITWTRRYLSTASGVNIEGIAYGINRAVAVGTGATIESTLIHS